MKFNTVLIFTALTSLRSPSLLVAALPADALGLVPRDIAAPINIVDQLASRESVSPRSYKLREDFPILASLPYQLTHAQFQDL